MINHYQSLLIHTYVSHVVCNYQVLSITIKSYQSLSITIYQQVVQNYQVLVLLRIGLGIVHEYSSRKLIGSMCFLDPVMPVLYS